MPTRNLNTNLKVTGSIELEGILYDGNSSAGTNGQVLSSTSTGTDWVTLSEISGVDGTGTANYLSKWLDANTITNSLVYDNGTNVGIGTTSPDKLLHLEKSSSTSGEELLRLENPNTDGKLTKIGFITNGLNQPQTQIFGGNDNSGQGGQGGNSGAGKFKVTISNPSGTHQQVIYAQNDSGTNNKFTSLSAGGSEIMRLRGDGNVGIGTTNPANKLHVEGGNIQLSDNQHITWGYGGNNAIYGNNTSDFINIFTNGSERLRINASGQVGIGTTSPSSKLHLGTSCDLLFERGGELRSKDTGGGVRTITRVNSANELEYGWSGAGPVKFMGGGSYTERMRIHTNGNVGIGTTSPAKTLDIVGEIRTSGRATFNEYVNTSLVFGTTDLNLGYAGGTSGIFIKGSTALAGNVGIGTGHPLEKLHVVGTNIRLDSNSGGFYKYTAGGGFRFALYDDSSKTYLFADGDGSNPHMTFNAGFVGIGTENPAAELDVFSAASFRADVATGNPLISIVNNSAVSNTAGTATIKFTQGNTQAGGKIVSARDGNYSSGATRTSNLQFYTSTAASDTEKMRITSAGNVGIGTTSPAQKLHVNGNVDIDNGGILLQQAYGINLGVSGYDILMPSTTRVGIKTAGTERLSILNNGRVGIGTTSPSQKLHVAGTIYSANSGTDGGSIRLANTGGGSNWYWAARTTGLNLGELGAADNRIFIKNGGNVGIGTGSPIAKLHVSLPNQALGFDSSIFASANPSDYTVGRGSGITFQNADVYTGGVYGIREANDWTGALAFYTHTSSANNTFGSTFTEKMRITSGGNVGIGTISPFKKLDLGATSSETDIALNYSDSGTNLGQIGFALGSNKLISGDTDGDLVLRNSVSGKSIIFGTVSAERMRINSSGNVGIGTTNPIKKLQVNGSILVKNNSGYTQYDGQGNVATLLNLTPNNELTVGQAIHVDSMSFNVGGTDDAIFINSSANVGIGTASPYAYDTTTTKLHVRNAGSSGSISEVARLEGASDADGSGAILRIGTSNDRGIYLEGGRTGSVPYASIGTTEYNGAKTEGIRITSTGNVGIGTNSPSADLHVNGDVQIGSSTSANAYGALQVNQTSNVDEEGIAILSASAGRSIRIWVDETKSYINSGNGGSGDLILNEGAGNVGIGTTNPSAKLHVAGSGRIGGGLNVNGAITNSSGTVRIESAGGQEVEIASTRDIRLLIDSNNDDTTNRFEIQSNTSVSNDNNIVFVVEQDGKVGIGTTAPTVPLDVVGAGKFTGQVTIPATPSASTDAASKGYVDAQVGSADTLQEVTDNGNTTTNSIITSNSVGIGTTTNPPHRLVVTDGASPYSSSNILLQVKRNSSNGNDDTSRSAIMLANNSNAFTIAYGGTTDRLRFIDGGNSEALTILNGGRVGIGTNSPSDKLEVYANGADVALRIHEDAGTHQARLHLRRGGSDWEIINDNHLTIEGEGTERMRITTAGDVGIGITNPSQRLEVGTNTDVSAQIGRAHVGYMGFADHAGFSHLDHANSSSYALLQSNVGDTFINSAASRHIYFRKGNTTIGGFNNSSDFYVDTDSLYVDASANSVGVGTTTPTEKLEVSGRIKSSDGLLSNGFNLYAGASTTGFLIKLDVTSGNYAHIHGALKLQQFNVSSQQIINFSATTLNNGTVQSSAATADIDVTIKLFVYNGKWYIHVPSPSTYTDISAYVHLGAGYQGSSRASNCIISVTSAAVPSSGVSGSVDIVAQKRILANTSGNVGIGTTNPATSLHVFDSAGPTIRFERSNNSKLDFTFGSTNTSIIGAGELQFRANGGTSNKFVINNSLITANAVLYASANVGIGTTNPTAKLDIVGDGADFFLQSVDYKIARIQPRGASGANLDKGLLSLFDGSTEDVRIDTAGNSWFNGGNIGIGQGSPTAKLHLKGDGGSSGLTFKTTDHSDNETFFIMDGGRAGVRYSPFSIGIPSTTSLATNAVFQVEEAGLLTVLNTGKVGIGTGSPSEKLEVIGTGTQLASTGYYINASFKGSSNVGVFLGHNNTHNGNGMVAGINKLAFLTYGTSWGERMVIDGSGNVTINAGNLFLANSSSRISNGANGEIGFNYNTSATGSLVWYGGGTTSKFSVTNGGNATFAGKINAKGGASISGFTAATINAYTATVSSNLYSALRIVDNTAASTYWDIGAVGGANPDLKFFVNASTTPKFTLSTNGNALFTGNVGIGTTNPSQKLDVGSGHIRLDAGYSLQWDNSHERIEQSDANLEFFVNNGQKVTIDSDGLDVNGITTSSGFRTDTSNTDYNLITRNSAGNAPLYVQSANTNTNQQIAVLSYGSATANAGTKVLVVGKDKSYFDNTNLGIGTSNPTEKLHVNGNIELKNNSHIGSLDGSYWQRIRFEDATPSTTNAFNFETRNGSGSYIKHMVIRNDGNVGIGVTNPSYALQVGGSIVGTSKNFIIDHPTKEGKKLLHGCIEGPEAAVYFRGKSTSNIIEMPDYWIGLVDIDTMTVDITPWGPNQDIYVESIADDGEVTIAANTEEPLNYFYVVYGERKDIDKLEIEIIDPKYSD